jgi:hypothetical protein
VILSSFSQWLTVIYLIMSESLMLLMREGRLSASGWYGIQASAAKHGYRNAGQMGKL